MLTLPFSKVSRPLPVNGSKRSWPVDDNTFWIIVPGSGGRAIGYQFVRNIFMTEESIGGPARPWRLGMVRDLPSINDDPTTLGGTYFSTSFGARDYALKSGGLFGGSFHGGETVISEVILADFMAFNHTKTLKGIRRFEITRTSRITWPGGEVIIRYRLVIDADNVTLQVITAEGDAVMSTDWYWGMAFAQPDFQNILYDNVDLTIEDGDYAIPSSATVITFRDGETGRYVRIENSARELASFERQFVRRNASYVKYYPEMLPGPIGTLTLVQKVTYGKGAADPVPPFAAWHDPFSGSALDPLWKNGAQTGNTISAVSGGKWTLTRQSGSGQDRWFRRLRGLTVGKFYTIDMDVEIVDSPGSPSAGVSAGLGVVPNSGSNVGAVFYTGINAVAFPYTFQATQTAYDLIINQGDGTAGQKCQIAWASVDGPFDESPVDPPFEAVEDLLNGSALADHWINSFGPNPVVGGGVAVFTRLASGAGTRFYWTLKGLTPGEQYVVDVDWSVTNSTSPSAGTSFGIGTAGGGSITGALLYTGINLISFPYTFTATQARHDLLVNQGIGTAGQELRLSRVAVEPA